MGIPAAKLKMRDGKLQSRWKSSVRVHPRAPAQDKRQGVTSVGRGEERGATRGGGAHVGRRRLRNGGTPSGEGVGGRGTLAAALRALPKLRLLFYVRKQKVRWDTT